MKTNLESLEISPGSTWFGQSHCYPPEKKESGFNGKRGWSLVPRPIAQPDSSTDDIAVIS